MSYSTLKLERAGAAIARTLPLGSVAVEAETNERGERYVWREKIWVNRLRAMRGPGESYSDVQRAGRMIGAMLHDLAVAGHRDDDRG